MRITTLLFAFSLTLASQSLLAEEITDANNIDTTTFWGIQLEELEYRYDDGVELGAWNSDSFYGNDSRKFRWLSQGEYEEETNGFSTLENQLLVQVPISTFFDAKAGVRFDTPQGINRTYAVVGIAGLAPQWFEVDVNFYVSEEGGSSADFDAEYELLLTNWLILTTSFEVDIAFSNDSEIGIRSGLNSTELGVRLSYDLIDRSFSPYIGFVQENLYGNSADDAKDEGEKTDELFFVVGAKINFQS